MIEQVLGFTSSSGSVFPAGPNNEGGTGRHLVHHHRLDPGWQLRLRQLPHRAPPTTPTPRTGPTSTARPSTAPRRTRTSRPKSRTARRSDREQLPLLSVEGAAHGRPDHSGHGLQHRGRGRHDLWARRARRHCGRVAVYPGAPAGSTIVMYTEKELEYYVAADTNAGGTNSSTTGGDDPGQPRPYISQDVPQQRLRHARDGCHGRQRRRHGHRPR